MMKGIYEIPTVNIVKDRNLSQDQKKDNDAHFTSTTEERVKLGKI